jgi:hypothetical protein
VNARFILTTSAFALNGGALRSGRARVGGERNSANGSSLVASYERLFASARRIVAPIRRKVASIGRLVANAERLVAGSYRLVARAERPVASFGGKVAKVHRLVAGNGGWVASIGRLVASSLRNQRPLATRQKAIAENHSKPAPLSSVPAMFHHVMKTFYQPINLIV